ncbi:MAG: hypothetical protein GY854_04475 [Deltaproteobacteria bacterium]|nr:hypothetical protein [Deltaproteobacteria bacterium]
MAYEGLDFGHVKNAIGTFVNRIAGMFVGEKEGEEEAGDDEAGTEIFDSEHWGHYGFESRPHPEDEKGRCEVIFSRNEDVTICSKDRRYRINLKDGEVGIYTGEEGGITCKQILKPDGTMVLSGKNYGLLVQKQKGDGGDVVITAENSVTMSQGSGTSSLVTIKKDGAIQATTAGGSHMTLSAMGKASLAVPGASVTLDAKLQQAEVNAMNISLVGTTGAGIAPNKLPVATVGCMIGPFPIMTGSPYLWAQYPM